MAAKIRINLSLSTSSRDFPNVRNKNNKPSDEMSKTNAAQTTSDTIKLRFRVGNPECHNKDGPKEITTIEVALAGVSKPDRILLADRLVGIDVCRLWNCDDGTMKMINQETGAPDHIVAETADYAGLMKAIRADQAEAEERQARHRSLAFAHAVVGLDMVRLTEQAARLSTSCGREPPAPAQSPPLPTVGESQGPR